MLTADDLIRTIDRLTVRHVELFVARRWLIPVQTDPAILFAEIDLARAQLLRDLYLDMALDEEALPTVLRLMDRMYRMRSDMRRLCAAIASQPDDVQQAILAQLHQPPDGP